jgi:hypothetical protein
MFVVQDMRAKMAVKFNSEAKKTGPAEAGPVCQGGWS